MVPYPQKSATITEEELSMPKVTVIPVDGSEPLTVEFESGKLPFAEHGKAESLLDVCLHYGIPLEHACGGSCACTTCHVIVKQGDQNLSEMDDDEADRLEMAPGLTIHSRLGCQAVVKGDVVVEIPSWNRNYVSEGGGSINLGGAIPPPKTTVGV
jgi:ferredoxin, 2Fe-2S